MLVDPRGEALPELSTDALSNAKMEEMNPDQTPPQMPAPHRPYPTKDNRVDDERAQDERKRVSRATGDGQQGNDAANHQSMLVRRQRQSKEQPSPKRMAPQRKQNTGGGRERHQLNSGVVDSGENLRRGEEEQRRESPGSPRSQAPTAPEQQPRGGELKPHNQGSAREQRRTTHFHEPRERKEHQGRPRAVDVPIQHRALGHSVRHVQMNLFVGPRIEEDRAVLP